MHEILHLYCVGIALVPTLPTERRKVAEGIARYQEGPEKIRGISVHEPCNEIKGDGTAGKKKKRGCGGK